MNVGLALYPKVSGASLERDWKEGIPRPSQRQEERQPFICMIATMDARVPQGNNGNKILHPRESQRSWVLLGGGGVMPSCLGDGSPRSCFPDISLKAFEAASSIYSLFGRSWPLQQAYTISPYYG